MTPADQPPQGARPPRRRRLVLVALAALLMGAGLWWAWRCHARLDLPPVGLDGADPEVAALIRRTEDQVRRHPRSPDAWGRLGRALLANKFEAESVGPFARAESLDPGEPSWPYLRGVALLGQSPDEALPCLRRAVAAGGDEGRRAAARLRLAEVLLANGHHEDAEAQYREVPAGPLSPCVEYGLGALAAIRGDLASGKRHLLRCADSPLTRQKAAAQLAALSRRLGEDASKHARRARELPPDPPWPDPFLEECLALATGKEGRMRYVTVLEQQGQADRALDALRALALDYPDPQTLLTLGITLGRRGHYRESEAALRTSLQQEPELVRALYYLSLALFAQGEALKQRGDRAGSTAKFEGAARQARRAVELAPQNGEAHLQFGLALWCLNRREEAIAAFRRAVATRPELADAHLWLGRALAEDGKKEEAVLHLRDAVRYAPAADMRPRKALEHVLRATKP